MKPQSIIPLLAFIFTIGAIESSAQNIFYKPGESGFGLGFQIGTLRMTSLTGLCGSYTIDGKLSGNLGVSHVATNNYGESSTTITPALNYLAIRQNNKDLPVSANLTLAYQFTTIKYKFPKVESKPSTAFQMGVGIHKEINTSNQLTLFPGAGLVYSYITIGSGSTGQSHDEFSLWINGSVLFRNFYITPGVLINTDETFFNVSVGILFGR